MIYGLVLAGGRSSRFGREKALAEFDGRAMIAHVHAVLAVGCSRVAVSAPTGSGAAAFARANDLDNLADAPDDWDGPLAGIKAGLTWARGHGAIALVTAPCDTPLLPADFVERLATAQRDGCAVLASTTEGLHPLCALWPVTGHNAAERAFAVERHPAVRSVLSALNAIEVNFEQGWRFDNLNTPAELQVALMRARAFPPGRD